MISDIFSDMLAERRYGYGRKTWRIQGKAKAQTTTTPETGSCQCPDTKVDA
jgi:hypothetical protein